MPVGELAAIGSAVTWAIGGVLLRSQTGRVDALTLNGLQYAFAATVFLIIGLVAGTIARLGSVSLTALAWVVGGSMLGMIVGDTLYVRSLACCGVARAFPVTSSLYMLFATIGAVALLGETATWNSAMGGIVIAFGIWLIATPGAAQAVSRVTPAPLQGSRPGTQVPNSMGLDEWAILAGAGFFWAVATLCLRTGMRDLDPLTANSVRMPLVAFFLLTASVARHRGLRFARLGWRPVAAAGTAGLVGLSLGSVMFLYALQTAGAARSAILSSLSPLFGAPMSVLVFREPVTRRLLAGTLLCVAGTVLITLR